MMPSRIFPDHLWPSQPLLWALAFCLLFSLAFFLNDALLGLVPDSIHFVPDRIAMIFLPAFVRVVAVLVAGVAGLIGIAIGSFLVSYFYVGEELIYALVFSFTSAAGIFAAYWLMLKVLGSSKIAFTLINLVTLTFLYSALNALAHGLVWELTQTSPTIEALDLSAMMIGDLVGVTIGFYLTRLGVRAYGRFRPKPGSSVLP